MKKAQQNIGILTSFASKAGLGPLSNLVEIISTLSSSIYVIAGNEAMNLPLKNNQKIKVFGVLCDFKGDIFTKIINYIYIQLKFSSEMIKLAKNVDIWIFFTGSHALLLPALTAKLMRKKIVFALVDSITDIAKAHKNTFLNVLVNNVLIHSESINCKLTNRIILHSPILIKDCNLEKYKNKIYIAHEYFLDFNKFKIKIKFDERNNIVGYVGRLSEEKGVFNLVKAIPTIIEERDELKFLIGGNGQLRDEIKKYINEKNLNKKVELTGWISHDELPNYMNGLKLLVIPSYTESGPIIALEAMACGTPIIATKVGHVLNMIEDGKTGFIMENNSPECIVKNVLRALEHQNLDEIVENARELVEKEFTYEVAVDRYRKILKSF